MIALEPKDAAGCYFHFVNDEMLNESLSIDQLHVANNIYYIVQEEYKLNGSKIKKSNILSPPEIEHTFN